LYEIKRLLRSLFRFDIDPSQKTNDKAKIFLIFIALELIDIVIIVFPHPRISRNFLGYTYISPSRVPCYLALPVCGHTAEKKVSRKSIKKHEHSKIFFLKLLKIIIFPKMHSQLVDSDTLSALTFSVAF